MRKVCFQVKIINRVRFACTYIIIRVILGFDFNRIRLNFRKIILIIYDLFVKIAMCDYYLTTFRVIKVPQVIITIVDFIIG